MPHDMKYGVRGATSRNSLGSFVRLWSGGLKLPHEHQFADFIEGLGAGQLVGRQVLASPCHGEIQVGLRDQHGLLEVEIVRARNLLQKPVYKMPPGSSKQSIWSSHHSSSSSFSPVCESLSLGRQDVHREAANEDDAPHTRSFDTADTDLQGELSRQSSTGERERAISAEHSLAFE